MTDEDIDYSDIPSLTNEQLQRMRPLAELLPQILSNKVQVTMQLDADIVEWFKTKVGHIGESNFYNLINLALRQYMANQKESLEETLRRVIREELYAAPFQIQGQ
jgi:uncharacterized protein (DUF4415 family)